MIQIEIDQRSDSRVRESQGRNQRGFHIRVDVFIRVKGQIICPLIHAEMKASFRIFLSVAKVTSWCSLASFTTLYYIILFDYSNLTTTSPSYTAQFYCSNLTIIIQNYTVNSIMLTQLVYSTVSSTVIQNYTFCYSIILT